MTFGIEKMRVVVGVVLLFLAGCVGQTVKIESTFDPQRPRVPRMCRIHRCSSQSRTSMTTLVAPPIPITMLVRAMVIMTASLGLPRKSRGSPSSSITRPMPANPPPNAAPVPSTKSITRAKRRRHPLRAARMKATHSWSV